MSHHRRRAARLAQAQNDRDAFDALLDKGTRLFVSDMLDLAEEIASRVGQGRYGVDSSLLSAREFKVLQTGIGQTMTLSDMTGRQQVVLHAEAVKEARGGDFAAGTTVSPFVPPIRFEEALDNMLQRTPKLANTAKRVSELYSQPGGKAFAAARSASVKLTERIRQEVARAIDSGEPGDEVIERIQKDARELFHDWSRAYAETVYRTNMATAYQAGEFRELQDPDVADVIVGLEFSAVGDADTRPEHAALDGLVAPVNDPIWNTHSPPLGYNCRCTTIRVDRFDAEARGLLSPTGGLVRSEPEGFSGEPPAVSFRAIRPDTEVYG